MRKFTALLICLVLILSLTTATTACQIEQPNGSSDANGQKVLHVLLPEHPYGDMLISRIGEFENQTGISVIIEQLNESAVVSRQAEAIENDEFVADVFMMRPMTEALNFLKNDWMKPLNDYDFTDYPHNTLEIGYKDGHAHFVPLVVEWQVLYYRKDLLNEANISVPTNFDELEEAARALNKDGVAGFASRGAGSPAVSQLSGFIFNFGGRYIENGVAVFDTPEAIEAIRLYGRLLGMYGPNGVYTMSWSDIMALFQEGKVAMWTDASIFFGQLIDPELSEVPPENIGVATLPRGPAADQPYIMTSWGMSISPKTEDPESAMEFLRWATSVEKATEAMGENIPMARTSVWNDPSITDNINPEIVETMIHATQNGYPYAVPFMTSIVRARELIGDVISESINTSGTSPRLQSLASQRVAEVNALLEQDGEYGTAR